MALVRGNTAATFSSDIYLIPAVINKYFITNMTAGSIDVVIEVEDTAPTVFTILKVTLAADETKQYDIPIKMLIGDKFNITATGSCDYYFNVE